jgi:hypothetical protein
MEEITLLRNMDELKKFRKNFNPDKLHHIKFEKLEKYAENRVLITAEHAKTTRLKTPERGEEAYIGVGDTNTAQLAKLAAWHLKAGYILPSLLRTDIDLARPPGSRNLELKAPILKTGFSTRELKVVYISTAKGLDHVTDFYHKKIENLAPRKILAFHGMNHPAKTDILLGFGPDRSYIGGAKNAFRFKKFFKERLEYRLKFYGLRRKITIKIGRTLFTGTKNYPLYRHIMEHNKTHKSKRIGIHAEFNRGGRSMRLNRRLPKLRYQLAAQVLAECINEWGKY